MAAEEKRASGRARLSGIEAERRATNKAQTMAADPSASAWVSANAGTGKTHVLTNRVLRLLLSGTDPQRILCLTYTKAAAAEMSERAFKQLAQWVTADDGALAMALSELQQRAPAPEELVKARDLFTIAIETPGGLKVQTIHAFCERLLQRFPLEAGVAPQFAILDEEMARALEHEAIEQVLVEATRDRDTPLGQALVLVVAYAADDNFDALLRDSIRHRDFIASALSLDVDDEELSGAEAFYRGSFGVGAQTTFASLDRALARVLSEPEMERTRDVLMTGKKSDGTMAETFADALLTNDEWQRVAILSRVFLNQKGEKRDRLMTSELAGENAGLFDRLRAAQEHFHALTIERGHLNVLKATLAVLRLANATLQRYEALKQQRAALDFDDLIRATGQLVANSESAEWVLYKLDGGLDHILVDEAQDTAPAQWGIIAALANEFFSGFGARDDVKRTVFAVGDEKQSIYGFQGAAPEQFAAMGSEFQQRAESRGHVWHPIPLTLSFRSTEPVLAAVDRVFAEGTKAVGVAREGAEAVRHAAHRVGMAGQVELWPLERTEAADIGDVWQPFSDRTSQPAVNRLAERIARTIRGWLQSGERLESEGRPVRAGDILILVRKRRPFADAMVTALKNAGVAVAGADRLRLTDGLAVRDLMVLGDFLLLPEDDLALATVLKSPLFGLDDDDLIELAPGRRGSLWTALLRAGDTNARFKAPAETLKRWRARADLIPPFEFFAELLDQGGMRARILERLGPEAAELLDEFLGLALTYDDQAPPSLQGFIHWLRQSEREVKRDMEHGRDEVRVMTVHGAKGLEAPIVFLPDTCTTGSGNRPGNLLVLDHLPRPSNVATPFLWPVKGSSRLPAVMDAKQYAKGRETEERNRLLYVALTRPRDRLYVAGFEGVKGRDKGCWYDLVSEALDGMLEETETSDGPVRRLSSPQAVLPSSPKETTTRIQPEPMLPDWARRPAPREQGLVVPLAPSRLAPLEVDAEGDPVEPARDPVREPPLVPLSRGSADGNRFLRGTLTHALLQYLPELDPTRWPEVAAGFVAARGPELKPRTRASIVAETLEVLNDPEFGPIFGPNSRAEVPIVAELSPPSGRGHVLRVTGQIDRLVRLETHVLIVDFKTNRPPPTEANAVAEAYLLQLAAYRLAIAGMFKPLPVRAALLWTDGPRLMEISGDALDAAANRLFALER